MAISFLTSFYILFGIIWQNLRTTKTRGINERKNFMFFVPWWLAADTAFPGDLPGLGNWTGSEGGE
jgi:hypothetical protein